MGFLREKYTREYFLGQDINGNKLNYGAIGGQEFLSGQIGSDIQSSLSLLPSYTSKNILEIGFGRGESIWHFSKYNFNNYIGIDFSEAAFNLAKENVINNLTPPLNDKMELHCSDALDFLVNHINIIKQTDVIVMLDCIEHIPTNELNKIWELFAKHTKKTCYLIAHTPFYTVDEDYIEQGCVYKSPSYSDLIEETKGMHCNKFTRERFFSQIYKMKFRHLKDHKLFVKSGTIRMLLHNTGILPLC